MYQISLSSGNSQCPLLPVHDFKNRIEIYLKNSDKSARNIIICFVYNTALQEIGVHMNFRIVGLNILVKYGARFQQEIIISHGMAKTAE